MRDYSLEDMEEENKEYANKERANMPDISNISLNANYAATTKISPDQPSKQKPILTICKICDKQYNQQTANSILSTLPPLPNFDYINTCLTCIQEKSQQIKAEKHPQLKALRKRQDIINKVYQESYNKWKSASNAYQALDYQESIIKHYLTKPVATTKPSTKKKDKTTDQIKKETALKIMSNLTPEQQAVILAALAKRSIT